MADRYSKAPAGTGQFSIGKLLNKIPFELWYALSLFIFTRVALTVVGLIVQATVASRDLLAFPDILYIWDVWDSERYISIAQNWYPASSNFSDLTNYVFFPLYPLLMRLLAFLIGSYLEAGLVISSVSMLVACVYLYRIVRMDDDEHTARRSIKYLFLFPTAFILSGVFTESLFLALSLACLYYAKKGSWLPSGALGALTALSRPYGIVIVLPMAYEYLRSKDYKLANIQADLLCLLLPPLGLSLYSAYNYYLTGDFLAFLHARTLWGPTLANPVIQLLYRFTNNTYGFDVKFNAMFTLAAILLLMAAYKKVDSSYLIWGLLLVFIPLSTATSPWSMSRYILPAFPLFIIFAKVGTNKWLDIALTIGLATMQCLLMADWTLWGFYVI